MMRFGIATGILLVSLAEPVLARTEVRARHRDRRVGEVEPTKRKRAVESNREPAILNLNAELEVLSELNAGVMENGLAATSDELIKSDAQAKKSQEIFFNKFLVVDDKVMLFGDELTGVLSCKEKEGGNLVISQGRQISTQAFTPPPGSRFLGFKDGSLCQSALTVFKNDPQGQSRLIVVETLSEKVVRFDIR